MTWGRRKDLKIINEQDLEQLPFESIRNTQYGGGSFRYLYERD